MDVNQKRLAIDGVNGGKSLQVLTKYPSEEVTRRQQGGSVIIQLEQPSTSRTDQSCNVHSSHSCTL